MHNSPIFPSGLHTVPRDFQLPFFSGMPQGRPGVATFGYTVPSHHPLKPRFDLVGHFLATQPVQSHLGHLATQPFLGHTAISWSHSHFLATRPFSATRPFPGHTARFLATPPSTTPHGDSMDGYFLC